MTDSYGMNGDPMDPKCRHGVWMVSQPGRSNYCSACERGTEVTDNRLVTTEHLIRLNEKAKALDLNHFATDEFITRLDPKCFHLAVIQVFGHNMDHHPTFHHRVFLWCKMIGTTADDPPADLVLDMVADDWDGLLTVEEVMG